MTKEPENKLFPVQKPCPFCGENEGKVAKEDGEFYVRCGYCGAKGPWTGAGVASASILWDERKD
jgi:hypothetical protein